MQGRYFCQAAGLRPDVYLTLQYRPPHQNVILNTEGKADTLCIAVKYRQSIPSFIARAQCAKSNGGANERAGLMAMNAFQRVQSDPLAFCRQINA